MGNLKWTKDGDAKTTDDTRPLTEAGRAYLAKAGGDPGASIRRTAIVAIEAEVRDAERARHAALVAAAQQMWFAHTEDETFRPTGPLSTDPYGEFEDALRAALIKEARK